MNFLPEDIEQYACAHSGPEPEILVQLTRETWQKAVAPRMLSGHLQGRWLSMISYMLRPGFVLEIGTYTGYSALCLAEGLAEGGKLLTIDINDELAVFHRKYLNANRAIEVRYGNALDLVPKIEGTFDLVFIDADKENYRHYYDMILPRLRPGGIMLLDNMLWSGKVLQPPAPGDEETRVLQQLNQFIAADERVHRMLLPLRDGLMVVLKK